MANGARPKVPAVVPDHDDAAATTIRLIDVDVIAPAPAFITEMAPIVTTDIVLAPMAAVVVGMLPPMALMAHMFLAVAVVIVHMVLSARANDNSADDGPNCRANDHRHENAAAVRPSSRAAGDHGQRRERRDNPVPTHGKLPFGY